MVIRIATAVLCGLALGAGAIWLLNKPLAPASGIPAGNSDSPQEMEMMTLHIGAGGGEDTLVDYTCSDGIGEVVTSCGPHIIEKGEYVWTEEVTVPKGTTVRVQASGDVVPVSCWITDETDRLTLDRQQSLPEAFCEAVAD